MNTKKMVAFLATLLTANLSFCGKNFNKKFLKIIESKAAEHRVTKNNVTKKYPAIKIETTFGPNLSDCNNYINGFKYKTTFEKINTFMNNIKKQKQNS